MDGVEEWQPVCIYLYMYRGVFKEISGCLYVCIYVYKMHRNAKILPLVPATRAAMLPGTRDCYQTAAAVHRQA